MLRKRIVTAFWGFLLVILAVWFDTPVPWFTILAVVCAGLAVYEFYRITGVLKVLPLAIMGMVWTLLFIIQPHLDYAQKLPLLLTSGVSLSLMMLVFLRRKEDVFHSWAWMMGGVLYAGWLLSLLVELRLEAGRNWLYLAFFATFASDSAAYFIGRTIGRHKMAPRISPGKTWEGAAAGLFGGIIVTLLFTLATPLHLPLNWGQAVILGMLISIFGQIGDLVESLLKRNTGVKDSGSFMPGHGGLLDRLDSVTFAGVVVYLFFTFML